MVIHNLRSPEQWHIISEHYDFKDKSVIDLGCGWCDLLVSAKNAGASDCIGIDKERHFYDVRGVSVIATDLEKWVDSIGCANATYDVALCFSVLPYLNDPGGVLEWMEQHAQVSFIECQYKDDGPGFTYLKSDDDMRDWLELRWPSVKPIGHTIVKDRNKKRTIWMCE